MHDSASAIWTSLHSGATPVVIVFYGDFGLRRETIAEVLSVAPPAWPAFETRSVDEALARPESLVLLVPDDERAAVEELDGLRDAFRERRLPVVLFLLSDGDGARLLPECLSLPGWIRGGVVDMAADEVDERVERERFLSLAGCSPEEWLTRYRGGGVDASAASMARTYRAMLIERG